MAFAYNGSSSYTSLGALSLFDSGGVFSLNLRFRFGITGGEQKLITVGGFGSVPYSFFNITVMPTLGVRFEAGNPFTYSDTSGILAIDTWHFCNVVWSGTDMLFLVNGVTVTSRSYTNTGWDNSISTLGRNGGVSEYYLNGQLADLALWNVALTSAELSSLWAGMPPQLVRPQSLFDSYPLVREAIGIRGNPVTNTSVTVSNHPRIYG